MVEILEMNSRERMRASNKRAVNYLLKHYYTEIWLKSHTRRNDTTYCREYNYKSKDLWNLFDGICMGITDKKIYFIQIKTNSWPNMNKYIDFSNLYPMNMILINVKKQDGKWKILSRIL